jgi:D-sedoheptulose 7-phosphate isomerase
MKNLFLQNIQDLSFVLKSLEALNEDVCQAGFVAANCIRGNGKIFFCGNGGSAADSQHLAAELTGRFLNDRRPLPAISLTTDTSALTCIGNDYSFNEIFSRQLAGLGKEGDLLIAISTSGNSGNVIRAVEEAQKLRIKTIGFLGRDGGKLRELCDQSIVVPSQITARIQECHILIGHTICGLIEQELGLA